MLEQQRHKGTKKQDIKILESSCLFGRARDLLCDFLVGAPFDLLPAVPSKDRQLAPTDLNKKALQDKKRLKNILSRTPMHRLGSAKEIVSAALFLASPDSSFVTGACIPVDGGFLAWAGF